MRASPCNLLRDHPAGVQAQKVSMALAALCNQRACRCGRAYGAAPLATKQAADRGVAARLHHYVVRIRDDVVSSRLACNTNAVDLFGIQVRPKCFAPSTEQPIERPSAYPARPPPGLMAAAPMRNNARMDARVLLMHARMHACGWAA